MVTVLRCWPRQIFCATGSSREGIPKHWGYRVPSSKAVNYLLLTFSTISDAGIYAGRPTAAKERQRRKDRTCGKVQGKAIE